MDDDTKIILQAISKRLDKIDSQIEELIKFKSGLVGLFAGVSVGCSVLIEQVKQYFGIQ